jgi:hypothetical protein
LKSFEPIKRNPGGKDGKPARPSSMHALGASKRQEAEDPPRKGVKIAFGSNRDLDKNSTGQPSRLAQQGAKAVSGGRGGGAADAVSGFLSPVICMLVPTTVFRFLASSSPDISKCLLFCILCVLTFLITGWQAGRVQRRSPARRA